MTKKYLIIGSGFSGAVLAHQLATRSDCSIDIWYERDHIGGNCHTKRDEQTGIMVHQYGPHIFNTDRKEIWDFVNKFIELKNFPHKVKAITNGKVYSMPVTLHTINQFFDKTFSPAEAKKFLESVSEKVISEPKNFE